MKSRVLIVLRWLSGLEWLAVAAPFLLFPTVRAQWTVVALIGMVILWLLRWIVRKEPWPVTPFNGALLLFAVMIPVAIWASAIPELTLPKSTGLVLGLAIFRVVGFSGLDRRSFGLALVAYCLLAVMIIGVGAVSAKWLDKVPILTTMTYRIPQLITYLPDLNSTGVSANQIAGTLNLYLPLALALVVGKLLGHWTGRASLVVLAGCLGFLLLVGGMLLLTQSRSGWIGGMAGLWTLAVLGCLVSRRHWVHKMGAALPVVTLAAAAVAVLWIGPERMSEMFYGVAHESLDTVAGTVTLRGRVEIWSRALYAIQDFAFTGCGLGTFRRVVHILYPLFLMGPNFDIAHAHNIFLQTALDVGLPGLVAYLALLIVAGSVCWQCARQGHGLVKWVALGLAAGLVGLHVYGLADAVALGAKPGVAFWMALGLIAAMPQVIEREVYQPASGKASAESFLSIFTRYLHSHRWLVVMLICVIILITAAGIYWGTCVSDEITLPQSTARLPLYPNAQSADVRVEEPPADAVWAGLLEITTFTTTYPITNVVDFYTSTLVDSGWQTDMEAGDETSWGGIYTQNEGRSVCLLNVFSIGEDVWVSIVCGDKVEPVGLPPLPPLETPVALPATDPHD